VHRKLLSLLAVALALFGARGALAADLAAKAPIAPPPMPAPVYNWGGWYAGGNIGYGWGTSSNTNLSFSDPGGAVNFAGYFAAGGDVTPVLNPKGGIGGGQIGFNWTLTPSWVVGLVTDLQDSGIKASATNTVTPAGFVTSNQSNSEKIDWFGTVRAKLGYAQNNWLFYGTGGLAYGRVEASGNFFIPLISTPFPGSSSATRTGWAAGGGLDYALTTNWIIGVEYLYVDLGHIAYTESNPSSFAPVASLTISNRAAAQIARATLDYKF
jgi:outer membrane immunogenic protein